MNKNKNIIFFSILMLLCIVPTLKVNADWYGGGTTGSAGGGKCTNNCSGGGGGNTVWGSAAIRMVLVQVQPDNTLKERANYMYYTNGSINSSGWLRLFKSGSPIHVTSYNSNGSSGIFRSNSSNSRGINDNNKIWERMPSSDGSFLANFDANEAMEYFKPGINYDSPHFVQLMKDLNLNAIMGESDSTSIPDVISKHQSDLVNKYFVIMEPIYKEASAEQFYTLKAWFRKEGANYVPRSGTWNEKLEMNAYVGRGGPFGKIVSGTPTHGTKWGTFGENYNPNGFVIFDVISKPTSPKCELKDGKYYGKDGKVITQSKFEKDCGCRKENGKFYDDKGNETDEATYKKLCERPTYCDPSTQCCSDGHENVGILLSGNKFATPFKETTDRWTYTYDGSPSDPQQGYRYENAVVDPNTAKVTSSSKKVRCCNPLKECCFDASGNYQYNYGRTVVDTGDYYLPEDTPRYKRVDANGNRVATGGTLKKCNNCGTKTTTATCNSTDTGSTAIVDEGYDKTTGQKDLETCATDKDSGSGFNIYSVEACSIGCVDKAEISVPGSKSAFAGRYWLLNKAGSGGLLDKVQVKVTRTCVTSKIDKTKSDANECYNWTGTNTYGSREIKAKLTTQDEDYATIFNSNSFKITDNKSTTYSSTANSVQGDYSDVNTVGINYNATYLKRVEEITYKYTLPTVYTQSISGKASTSQSDTYNIKLEDNAVPVSLKSTGNKKYTLELNDIINETLDRESIRNGRVNNDKAGTSIKKQMDKEGKTLFSGSNTKFVCNYKVKDDITVDGGKPKYFYRVVNLGNINPSNRILGYNWNTDTNGSDYALDNKRADYTRKEMKEDNNSYTKMDDDTAFEFVLTPTTMSNIREYNKKRVADGGYNDNDLICTDNSNTFSSYYCKSQFLACLGTGSCYGDQSIVSPNMMSDAKKSFLTSENKQIAKTKCRLEGTC